MRSAHGSSHAAGAAQEQAASNVVLRLMHHPLLSIGTQLRTKLNDFIYSDDPKNLTMGFAQQDSKLGQLLILSCHKAIRDLDRFIEGADQIEANELGIGLRLKIEHFLINITAGHPNRCQGINDRDLTGVLNDAIDLKAQLDIFMLSIRAALVASAQEVTVEN